MCHMPASVFVLISSSCSAQTRDSRTKAMSHQRNLSDVWAIPSTMIPLDLKRRLDPRVASVQRWWRLRAFRTVVSTCCCTCHRTATHIDHRSQKRLCGLCALHVRCLNNLHRDGRRIQTLAQFEVDVTAATVIQAFWLSWRATKRWQAIRDVTFTRATLFATRAQSVFRGNASRRAIRACMDTLVWLCRAANRLLQTKPGSWFVCLCDDLLSRVPVFLVGRECWRLAGEPHAGNEVAFRLLHDAVAGQITRLGRGWVSRCKARRESQKDGGTCKLHDIINLQSSTLVGRSNVVLWEVKSESTSLRKGADAWTLTRQSSRH